MNLNISYGPESTLDTGCIFTAMYQPKSFIVHLPSRVDSLGGNLVKSPLYVNQLLDSNVSQGCHTLGVHTCRVDSFVNAAWELFKISTECQQKCIKTVGNEQIKIT